MNRHFSKIEIQISNQYLKKCSILLSGNCKLKPQWGITSHMLGCLLSNWQEIKSVGENVKKREYLRTLGGNVSVKPLWQYIDTYVPLKIKIRTIIWSSNPTPGIVQRKQNRILKKYLYSHVHCGIFHIAKIREKNWNGLKKWFRGSLVAQCLRICLPMQGARVRALVWEDPTCRGATRPVSHNYWACVPGACAPQRERPR